MAIGNANENGFMVIRLYAQKSKTTTSLLQII